MEILYGCCAGLDVHKNTVVACRRRLAQDGQVEQETRTFSTMTADLLELADWLAQAGVTQVAMESTGIYWKPVWHLLEDRFGLILVNARHIKQVPGRKTDVKDAQWLAELLQFGLLKASFIPPPPIRELRALTRQRTALVNDRARVANRIQKVLEAANIKLSSVATDVLGASGRAMIDKLIAGEQDAEILANEARGSLKRKTPALRQALQGRVTPHHRFQLRLLMDQIRQMDDWIARLDGQVAEVIERAPVDQPDRPSPLAEAARRVATIPGVGRRVAEVIVAEIGPDVRPFATAGHLASWAGMCPGNHQSGGKRLSGKTSKGNQALRVMLVQAAWAASHTKETALSATYRRLTKRLGKKKALVALGHKLLRIIYQVLSKGVEYVEYHPASRAA